MDYFDNYSDFFEDRAYYTISQYSLDNPEFSESKVLHFVRDACGYGELQFANWSGDFEYSKTSEPYTIVLLPPESEYSEVGSFPGSLLEEMTCDNNWNSCSTNLYLLSNGTLSSDGKEVVFNITPIKASHSKGFNAISIKKVS